MLMLLYIKHHASDSGGGGVSDDSAGRSFFFCDIDGLVAGGPNSNAGSIPNALALAINSSLDRAVLCSTSTAIACKFGSILLMTNIAVLSCWAGKTSPFNAWFITLTALPVSIRSRMVSQ